ncbi:conserved Plasmodium protein, unknown function [Plasmodium malariae]|uniref:Uncharacterized protein n=1 Tax=Plasmodium malariae TaxID=5858 RepID=A0A1A8W6X5_PLAMA|nr:conserved Plasmodium protein, unknown function [Plasmodium malariae]
MFSLIKSVFSNFQDEKDLKILIIGECDSGKTSLFNLISSYHNKSKYDILNTVFSKSDNSSNCALGFNTKKIIFNRKNLKIYDLEGTATNTISIYDCYYEDTDVIFYVIDAKIEKHIFKAIIYLTCLGRNRINDKKKNKNEKKEEFLRPIIILGNKSEDNSSFFSAPCISNYIKSIDIYKNEKFWQFFLSNNNTFLNYYLGVLYEKVVDYLIINKFSLDKFLVLGKEKDYKRREKQGLDNSELLKKCRSFIEDIKNNNKHCITIDEVENNELLCYILKNIVNENINYYKCIPVEVYNISVLKNKGIYEVIEAVFQKHFNRDNRTIKGYTYNNFDEKDTNAMKFVDRQISFYEDTNGNYYHSEKGDCNIIVSTAYGKDVLEGNIIDTKYNDDKYDEKSYENNKGNETYKNCHMNMNKGRDNSNALVCPYLSTKNVPYVHGSNQNYLLNNNESRNSRTEDTLSNTRNNAYIMYEYNTNPVNLFIEHIQHVYFGKDSCESIPNISNSLKEKNAKYEKKSNILKKTQQTKQIDLMNMENNERQNGTHVEKPSLKRADQQHQEKVEVRQEYEEGAYKEMIIYEQKETFEEKKTFENNETIEEKETHDSTLFSIEKFEPEKNEHKEGNIVKSIKCKQNKVGTQEINEHIEYKEDEENEVGLNKRDKDKILHKEANKSMEGTQIIEEQGKINEEETYITRSNNKKKNDIKNDLNELWSRHENDVENIEDEERKVKEHYEYVVEENAYEEAELDGHAHGMETYSKDSFHYNDVSCGDNYKNNISYTDYSSNEEKIKKGKDLFHKKMNPNNNMDDNGNYIYKSKIYKKKYSLKEKKKKKKLLYNKKIESNFEVNSSNSFENVSLMNVMCIDSLNNT